MSTPTPASLPLPGEVLKGRYEIVGIMGEGGMGVVFEARHLRLGHRVAIKMLRETMAGDPEVVERFEREARAAAQLQGAHIARVVDVDTLPDGQPFMVMEYLEGQDLDQILGHRGKVPPREAVDYILQACVGMAEAHARGIVHRDLKPDNLFRATGGGTPRIKVLDFGISKLTLPGESKSVTHTTAAFGTPTYMSPDQIQSTKHVDPRADIWSLGVILYELITGAPPFKGENATAIIWSICADTPVPLSQLCDELPEGLSEVVDKALQKDREQRYADIQQFAEALDPYGTPGMWAPPELGPPPARTSGRGAVTMSSAITVRFDDERPSSWTTSSPPSASRRVQLAVAAAALLLVGTVGVVLLTRPGASVTPVPAAVSTVPAEQPTATSDSDEVATTPLPEVSASASAAASALASASSEPAAPSAAPRSPPAVRPKATSPPKPTGTSAPPPSPPGKRDPVVL